MLIIAVHASILLSTHTDSPDGYALSIETSLDKPEYDKIITQLYENLDKTPVVDTFEYLREEDALFESQE